MIDLPPFLHHLGHLSVERSGSGTSPSCSNSWVSSHSIHFRSLGSTTFLPHKIPSASGLPSSLVPALYRCEMSDKNGGNIEIYEHGLEYAGSSPQFVLIYEAIAITNDVVSYSISTANSTFQSPQLILIPCQSLSQSLSLESITCIQPCFRSIIDIAETAFDTKVGFKSSANARLVSNTAIVSHSGIKAL